MGKDTEKRESGRANGEGSIYTTADGRLRGSIAWTDASGKRHRRYVSGKTRRAIERAIGKIRDELDRGLQLVAPGTVATFLEGWLAASRQRIRAATWEQYASCARRY